MDELRYDSGKGEALPLPKPDRDNSPPALLDKTAKESGWRLRMAKAAAQLFAGTEKGAIIYGEVRERLDTIEGRSIVSKAMAEAVALQAVNDPDLLERGKARFLGGLMQKQENLEAVVAAANEQLLLLPSPEEDEIRVEQHGDASTDDEPASGASSERPLNEDWATAFSSVAENATSEELRQRLARVLAGELASPGTYSRATVRKIAELERIDLEEMNRVLPFVFGDVVIRHRKAEKAPPLDWLLRLAEVGLVTEASGTISTTWPAAPEGGADRTFSGQQWAMQVNVEAGITLTIGIYQLTRTGMAVVDLLGRPDEQGVIRQIASDPDVGWKAIRMGRLATSERIHLPWIELYPAPTFQTVPPLQGGSPFAAGKS